MNDHETVDARIVALSRRQRGLIARWQLLALGCTDEMIRKRLKRGWFTRVFAGVYLVGGAVFDQAALRWAGVLRAGPDAALVRDSAGEERGVLAPRTGVAIVGRPTKSRKVGLRSDVRLVEGGFGLLWIKHASGLPDDVESIGYGPPMTSLGRTLIDLAGDAVEKFDRAWRHAEFKSLLDPVQIDSVLRRGLEGSEHVRRKLASHVEIDPGLHGYDSPAELDAIKAVVAAGFEQPLVNHWIRVPGGWRRVDLYFVLARLAIEIDGWDGHRGRDVFEDDHERDLELLDLDILTMRFTGRRITRKPADCARRIIAQVERRTVAG